MKELAAGNSNVRKIVSLRNVLIMALAVRLLLPLLAVIITGSNAQFYAPDTNSYIRPAVALLSAGRFARDGEPEIMRTPGYPIFLVPGIASGHVELATIILQASLSTLSVFLVYRTALLLFESTKIAILGAFLYAIEPVSILYSSKLLTETLFTTLIALFVYFLLRYWKGGSLGHLVASAVALAASVYVRPIGYYLPILVFILLFGWTINRVKKHPLRFVHLGAFLLASMGLIGLWQVRNKTQAGYPGFSIASDRSLYFYQGASVLATTQSITVDEAMQKMGFYDEEVYFRNFPDQRGWENGEIARSMGKAGLDIILGNAGVYSVLVLRGVFRILLDPGATEYLRMFLLYPETGGLLDLIIEQGLVSAVGFLFEEMPLVFWANLLLGPMLLAYLLLAILGVLQSRIVLSMPMMLFSGLTVYFLVLSAAGIGTHRARHPIMPIICVLAGYGLYWVHSNIRRKWSSLHAQKALTA